MKNHRNVLSAVAATLLVASLPANAQLLGGGASGALGGALGGTAGPGGINGSGVLHGDAAGSLSGNTGVLRERVRQTAGQARDGAADAAAGARSRAVAAKDAAGNASASVAGSANGAFTAGREATTPDAASDGISLDGEAAGQKDASVRDRNVSVGGRSGGRANVGPRGVNGGVDGGGMVSARKQQTEPAPAPAENP